ncbi:kinase-like domain-containing protein [Paecilomyces variotii]|uniref:Altered inheritance of mitochondria protein 9, mitochondrial n=1 Tax=Byssochlamys spectabilis TaxID=264951 RepID=A0A443HQ15_BYSSP|nr:kinase-like domain-containing protein [Paecilomyces variotii]RWQ93860.1 kinase-like domain-containing protein [Paecilomyces variotii]
MSLIRLKSRFSSALKLQCLKRISSGSLTFIRANTSRAQRRTMSETATLRNTDLRAITLDELFKHTSGRWLVNEECQIAQHYVQFDIEKLCRLAASLFSNQTKCARVTKIEGNYNIALLITMDDGNEVIAKIPCPNAGLPFYRTASEVATLEFLQSLTTIRVPKVLAWSSRSDNPIGVEYIIMEKIPGIPLTERWETMNLLECYKIIDQIVDMEKELKSLKYPAYGSIYLRDDVSNEFQGCPFPSVQDPAQLFCVGPYCNGISLLENVDKSATDAGPWLSFDDYTCSIPQCELDFIAKFPSKSVDEYGTLLAKASSIFPALSRDPRVTKLSSPFLRHPYLDLSNILISPDDATAIQGIVDWQSSKITPLFVQAHFPDFVIPPKDYILGPGIPTLPEDFDKLSSEQQEQAVRNNRLATLSKYYEMVTLIRNESVHDALVLDRRLSELFTCYELFPDGTLVPLRNCLIRVFQDWAHLGLPGQCPFGFTKEELERHGEHLVTEQLRTDNTGWYLYDMFIDTMSEEMSPEAAAKKWPFPPEDV